MLEEQVKQEVAVLYRGGFRSMNVYVNPVHKALQGWRERDLMVGVVVDDDVAPDLIVIRTWEEVEYDEAL